MLKIAVMLGDDIGIEVVPETVKVMKAAADSVGLAIACFPARFASSTRRR